MYGAASLAETTGRAKRAYSISLTVSEPTSHKNTPRWLRFLGMVITGLPYTDAPFMGSTKKVPCFLER
ncbi:hypothetical protein EC23916_3379 [Escherichia coli 2.3916]|nr:hypothetical protein EC23916_3379 [Escherichia coli 2.3916]